MILQALTGYYERMINEGTTDLEPEGFKRIAIPFIIVVKKSGRFVGLDDTRTAEGKRNVARTFIVPKIFEGSRTSNVQANLLWDKASYVFGVGPKSKKERLKKQKEEFLKTILTYFPNKNIDEGVLAVINFLEKYQEEIKDHDLWAEIKDADPNLAFRLESETTLICNRAAVKDAIANNNTKSDSVKGICLVSGRHSELARLENPIKGLWGSGKAESHLVAFNDPAYWSYGKSYGSNAPISKSASFAYTAAFNYLQRRGSRQCLQVADATTVFWAAKAHKMEDWFIDFFGEPIGGKAEQDYSSVKALYSAPNAGASPLQEDVTPFYVLGLAPNAARISVRFWYEKTVGQVARHIKQHFDDCAIVHGPKYPDYLSLFRLLVSTAVQGEAKNIQPNLSGEVMKAILAGTPYPSVLLIATLNRIRAEQSKHDPKSGKQLDNVSYPRAALIKAVLSRESRFYKKVEKEVTMSLDRSNENVGYLMGRLFAVLERAQEFANPGINATIRDRFYGAASSTPVAVFPHLMKLKNHHIAKLENKGMAVNMEKQIGEIVAGINDFPAHLSLADQGRFAIGYYHQRQDFFTKKETSD